MILNSYSQLYQMETKLEEKLIEVLGLDTNKIGKAHIGNAPDWPADVTFHIKLHATFVRIECEFRPVMLSTPDELPESTYKDRWLAWQQHKKEIDGDNRSRR